MLERLQYALIGSLFGAVVGVLLWWLFGVGAIRGSHQLFLQPELLAWIKPSALVGAVLGFALKASVGTVAGEAINLAFRGAMGNSEDTANPTVPRWLTVLVLLLVVVGVWLYARS